MPLNKRSSTSGELAFDAQNLSHTRLHAVGFAIRCELTWQTLLRETYAVALQSLERRCRIRRFNKRPSRVFVQARYGKHRLRTSLAAELAA